jgi:ABC-type phosphate transport system permease subunit
VPGLPNAADVAAGSAAVLLIIVLAINIGTAYLTDALQRRLRGVSGSPRAGGPKK